MTFSGLASSWRLVILRGTTLGPSHAQHKGGRLPTEPKLRLFLNLYVSAADTGLKKDLNST